MKLSSERKRNSYPLPDPADAVFYIQSGKVKKTVVSEEAVVAILGAGDFFGEGSLAGEALPECRSARPAAD
jgi:CRP-like cAMP-binding protein